MHRLDKVSCEEDSEIVRRLISEVNASYGTENVCSADGGEPPDNGTLCEADIVFVIMNPGESPEYIAKKYQYVR